MADVKDYDAPIRRDPPAAKPKPKKVFRIVTTHGLTIDMTDMPDGFSFPNTATLLRVNGYFMTETLFISADRILFMAYGDPRTMPNPMLHAAPTGVQ